MATINIKNLNNKLSCDVFYSIVDSNVKPMSASEFPVPVSIRDPATGNEFSAELISMARFSIYDIGSIVTYAATGLSAAEFVDDHLKGSNKTELVLLIYKKK